LQPRFRGLSRGLPRTAARGDTQIHDIKEFIDP
jgi:hypothetical protein